MFKRLALIFVFLVPTRLLAQTILVLGDSLSAGYGLSQVDQGWVALLQGRLGADRHQVINASIPGDTTAGGLARLPTLLAQTRPSVVVVALGANDGLRALSPVAMKTNLNRIIRQSKASGAKVVLAGIRLPPNYGPRYTEAFETVFPTVAEETAVPFVPFLLDGVGGRSELTQSDGLHPNEAAQPILLDNIWPVLQPLLHPGGAK